MCVYCLKKFAGHHASKMMQHPSGLYCSGISTCLGVSNGSVPVWIRESCKAAVVKKPNDLSANNIFYNLIIIFLLSLIKSDI